MSEKAEERLLIFGHPLKTGHDIFKCFDNLWAPPVTFTNLVHSRQIRSPGVIPAPLFNKDLAKQE